MATVAMIQPREEPARLGLRTLERIRARLYLLGFGLAMAAARLPAHPPGSGPRRCARPVPAAAATAAAARAERNPAAAGSARRRGPVHHLSRYRYAARWWDTTDRTGARERLAPTMWVTTAPGSYRTRAPLAVISRQTSTSSRNMKKRSSQPPT